MRAHLSSHIKCPCGFELLPNEHENSLVCTNEKCGNYLVKYMMPTINLRPLELDGSHAERHMLTGQL